MAKSNTTTLPNYWRYCCDEKRIAIIAALPVQKRIILAQQMIQQQLRSIWKPFSGPQTLALNCNADVIGFGGAGGGGKTDLILGRAIKRHRRAIVFRRTYPTLGAVIDRSHELLDHQKSSKYSEQHRRWDFVQESTNKVIRFGAMQYERDKENYRGIPDDLKAFDEAQNFTESQVRFVMGWARTNLPDQVVTVLLCFNPPCNAEGQWLINFFAPWLDEKHTNPAVPGEFRYFAMLDGEEKEVEGPATFEYTNRDGEIERITPKSRTFFPARVEDNPAYMVTGYRDMLAALPEPLRSQMLKGDFRVAVADDVWQVIPTQWVRLAMDRWQKTPRPTDRNGNPTPWTAVAGDIAAGGNDKTVFSRRVDDWYAELLSYGGTDTDDGAKAALLLIQAMEGANVIPNIDVIGIGMGLKTALTMQNIRFHGINVAETSHRRDKSGFLRMANLRAEIWWMMREALDPESGRNICLPNDRHLLADLCSARYSLTENGIRIEKNESIAKRIGRSPDRAVAVLLNHHIAEVAGYGKSPWGK